MTVDSRLYIKEQYIWINNKYDSNYEECAKAIAHEYRLCISIIICPCFQMNLQRWIKEMNDAVNTSNINETGSNYISQEIELDAFAFTKFNFESITVKSKIKGYDEIIDKYIIHNKTYYKN